MKYFFYFLIITTGFYTTAEARGQKYQLFEKEGKRGLKNNEGEVLIPAEYEELGWSKNGLEVINNVVGFKSNGFWGIINLQNEVVSAPTYTQLYPGSKGLLIAAIKGKLSQRDFLGAISTEGKHVLPFKYTSIEISDLRAIVSNQSGKHYYYGVVDLSDKTLIPVKYKDISFLGHLRFAVKDFNDKIAIYNDKGGQVLGFELDSISSFKHNLAIIYDNHLRGLINHQGQVVMPLGSKNFDISKEGVKVLGFNQWKRLDATNKTLALYNFDQIKPYANNKMKVNVNGKSWLIDTNGQPLTSIYYDELGEEENGHLAFRQWNKWGIMKINGDIVITPRFDSVFISEDMVYGREIISGKPKWSLYDTYGMKKSHHYYDKIKGRTQYLYPVMRQDHWGFINRIGEEIIHCVYDEVSSFVDGLVAVKFHGEYGVINKNGDWVVLPQFAKISLIDDDYYITKNGSLTTLKSYSDGTIYFTENPIEVKENYLLEHLNDGGVWKIDFKGRISKKTINNRYEEVRPASEGLFAAKIDGKYGFIDDQNRLRIANRYDDVGSFFEGLAAFKLLGRWGFIDKNERIIIQPIYRVSGNFQNGLAIVEDNKGVGLINTKGEKISSFEYDEIKRQENGRFLTRKDNKYGLINETGRLLINVKYDELTDLDNDFVIIKLFNQYGLLNLHGVDIIPVMYDTFYYDAVTNNYLGMKKSSWEDVRLP